MIADTGNIGTMVYGQQQHIFYRDNDRKIFHIFWDAPSSTLKTDQWGGPGGLTSAPAAAADY